MEVNDVSISAATLMLIYIYTASESIQTTFYFSQTFIADSFLEKWTAILTFWKFTEIIN